MSFRDSNRFEYFKQPHILVICILLILVCVAAILTGVRRVQQMQDAASANTYDACRQFVDDELLCKFAQANEAEGSENYTVTTTTTNGETTEVSTVQIAHADRMKAVTLNGLEEVESYTVIDATTYVKDYSDDTWAKYEDPDFTPSESKISYDFTNANSEDVIEFRDRYKNRGTEPCGEHTCHMYEVSYPDSEAKTFIWFDTEKFLLRRYQTTDTEVTTNAQFSYGPVQIDAPSPTKDVSADEIESYL